MNLAGFPPTTVMGGTSRGDDAVRADDGAVTDPYAGQHSGTYADPNLIFNDNGFTVRRAAVVRIRVMIDGDQVHFRRDEHTVADGDAATVEKTCTLRIQQPLPMRMFLPKST